jgi:predicted DNA-binding transcriptional regulator AlpA
MRNFLTTKDISRLSGYSRAEIWNRAKAGEIPGERVKYSGKRLRFIDSPEIRSWCEERRFGLIALEWSVIEGTVLAVIERDYRDNPDNDQLLKKWERAMRAGKREDLPRIDLSRLGSDILGEILRQLVDSKNPKQLLRKWARALLDGRFEDLPHAL